MAAGWPIPCLVPSAVPGGRRYRVRSFGYSKMKSAPLRETNDDMLEWLDDTIRQKTGGSLRMYMLQASGALSCACRTPRALTRLNG